MMEKGYVKGRDVAEAELNAWFDVLDVPEDMRIDSEDDDNSEFDEIEGIELSAKEKSNLSLKKAKKDLQREKVLRAIMKGDLELHGTDLVYSLKEPLKKKDSGETVLETLTFKNRYREFELRSNMKGVNPSDFLDVIRAYVSTLTNTPGGLLGKLYNRDSEMTQAIYTLFMRGEG